MDDLKSFYNSILNIRNQGRIDLIEEIVSRQRKELMALIDDVDGFCKYIARAIYEELKNNNVSAYIVDLNGIVNVDHVVIIAEYKEGDTIKRVLIDPTFEQFNKKDGRILKYLEEWPSEKIKDKEFVRRLLDKGFIEIDSISFSNYLSAFCKLKIHCDLDTFILRLRMHKNDDSEIRKRIR